MNITENSAFGDIYRSFGERISHHVIAIASGLLIAFESTIPYFIPCLIAVLLDVYFAYKLGVRVAKKYPDRADGKFKSSYKYRIFRTMILGLVLVILAHYADALVVQKGDLVVRYCVGIFIGYQLVSMLENWSSENDSKAAKILQKILVNKADRHFNVDISDLFENTKKKDDHGKL